MVVVLLASATTAAQVPVAELAKPPASARHFLIMSTGGKHGDSWAWTLPDGTRMSRESLNLRGQVWELDTAITPGPDGLGAHGRSRHHAVGRCGRDVHHRERQSNLGQPDRQG